MGLYDDTIGQSIYLGAKGGRRSPQIPHWRYAPALHWGTPDHLLSTPAKVIKPSTGHIVDMSMVLQLGWGVSAVTDEKPASIERLENRLGMIGYEVCRFRWPTLIAYQRERLLTGWREYT